MSERITDLQLAEAFCDLVDLSITEEPCEYLWLDGDSYCSDLLDSDTCGPCKARLAYRELEVHLKEQVCQAVTNCCRFRSDGYASGPGELNDVTRLVAELDRCIDLYVRSERFLLKRLSIADPDGKTIEKAWSE